jgi:hypothetical protein
MSSLDCTVEFPAVFESAAVIMSSVDVEPAAVIMSSVDVDFQLTERSVGELFWCIIKSSAVLGPFVSSSRTKLICLFSTRLLLLRLSPVSTTSERVSSVSFLSLFFFLMLEFFLRKEEVPE